MEQISLSGFLSGFASAYFALLAYLLFRGTFASPPTRLQKVLGVLFVQWALFNLKDFLLTLHDYSDPTALDIITLIDGLSLIGYTCLLYEVIHPCWTTWCKVCWMLVAYMPFFIAYGIVPGSTVITLYIIFLFVAGVSVFLLWLRQARTYTRYIHECFSNIDQIGISWLRIVAWFFVSCQLLWVVITLVRNPLTDCLYYVLSIVLWQVTLEHVIHHQPVAIEHSEPKEASSVREYAFAQTLPSVIEAEQLYLNPTLSVKELAQHIGTNRTYLSDYFVHELHTTFYDYINSLRIEQKSIPLLTEHPEYTIDRIAAESGFQSVSTFRRAFHKQKGVTPSLYRKQDRTIHN